VNSQPDPNKPEPEPPPSPETAPVSLPPAGPTAPSQGKPAARKKKPAAAKTRRRGKGRDSTAVVFVDDVRLSDLRAISSPKFDLRKVIEICDELNVCYRSQCYIGVAALTRTLLDHIPPIFGVDSFTKLANNYAGAKSFKASMKHLETSARNIADGHLHVQIRQRESLPTRTQVNFSADVDVLLGEIVRLLS
jgi:hypothetical protein